MRIIKLIIISFIGLFGILMMISIFIPSHVRISRAINIVAPVENIKTQVTDLRQWKKWNEMISEGGSYQQTSINAGGVDITMLKNSPESIETLWKYKNRKPVKGSIQLISSRDGITIVQWYFDFHQKWYPWEKFGSILFDKQMGPPMERSLENLKKLVENSP